MDILHRDDFCLGPISLDMIEPNLYLGGLAAARSVDTLTQHKITHILTIDTCPLPRKILELNHITTKFIQLCDQPHEDLLSYFDETFKFISKALLEGAILIHCYFGVSRSASVVLAYVMKKYNLTYFEAFDRVKRKRSIIFPNLGFVSQLKLYQEMECKINKNYLKYKKFRLHMAADRVKKVKILPQNFHDLIKPDPGLTQSQPEPNVYRCKKCRRILASESNLIVHLDCGSVCKQVYFFEPLAWMNVAHNTHGKLHCPKCKAKVGSFNWIMACQCHCGTQVVPAFYFTASKIDFSNVVKNMEATC